MSFSARLHLRPLVMITGVDVPAGCRLQAACYSNAEEDSLYHLKEKQRGCSDIAPSRALFSGSDATTAALPPKVPDSRLRDVHDGRTLSHSGIFTKAGRASLVRETDKTPDP
jgi:hypothetical protein